MDRGDFELFKKKTVIQAKAENAKIAVVSILVLSVILFSIAGSENVKGIIWHWAFFMLTLLIACAIQDIIIARKIKDIK